MTTREEVAEETEETIEELTEDIFKEEIKDKALEILTKALEVAEKMENGFFKNLALIRIVDIIAEVEFEQP